MAITRADAMARVCRARPAIPSDIDHPPRPPEGFRDVDERARVIEKAHRASSLDAAIIQGKPLLLLVNFHSLLQCKPAEIPTVHQIQLVIT